MNKKNKILLCTSVFPPDSGGVSAFAKDIFTMFNESDLFEINLFYSNKSKGKGRINAHVNSLKNSIKLLKTIMSLKPNIVICTAIKPYVPILTMFSKTLGFKLIVQVMGTEITGRFNSGWRKYLQVKSFNKCSSVWPISNFTRNMLIDYGVEKSIIYTFYPFVTNEMIDIAKKNMDINKNKKFTIFTSGHLVPRKGIDLVLKAVSQIKELDIQYFIAGNVPKFMCEYEGYYQNMANELDIENRVKFLGQLDRKQLWEHLSRSHLFIMHSRAFKDDIESFGIVYMEAQLFELPCIGTHYGGIPEAIATDEGGILVGNENIEGLVEAIKLMYENQEYRKETSVKSREYVLTYFSQNKRLNEIKILFNNLLD